MRGDDVKEETEVAKFYKDFFDGVNSFTKDFKGWKPYELG